MLVKFSVENFLSFNGRVYFDMYANNSENNLNGVRLNKIATIYGQYGVGKTNFVKAISFAKHLIVNGVKSRNIQISKYKLDRSSQTRISRFEFTIIANEKEYVYGFSIGNGDIVSEWLFEVNQLIYCRNEDGVTFGFNHDLLRNIPEDGKNLLRYEAKSLSVNKLFLRNCRERGISCFDDVYDWFNETLTVVDFHNIYSSYKLTSVNQDFKFNFNNFICDYFPNIRMSCSRKTPLDGIYLNNDIKFKHVHERSMFVRSGSEMYFVSEDNNGELNVERASFTINGNGLDGIILDNENVPDSLINLIDFFHILFTIEGGNNNVFIIDDINYGIQDCVLRIFDSVLSSNNNQIVCTLSDHNIINASRSITHNERWEIVMDKFFATKIYRY